MSIRCVAVVALFLCIVASGSLSATAPQEELLRTQRRAVSFKHFQSATDEKVNLADFIAAQWIQNTRVSVSASSPTSISILDVGCGDGLLAYLLLVNLRNADAIGLEVSSWTGVDVNFAYLSEAASSVRSLGLQHVLTVHGSAFDDSSMTQLDAAGYDLVLFSHVAYYGSAAELQHVVPRYAALSSSMFFAVHEDTHSAANRFRELWRGPTSQQTAFCLQQALLALPAPASEYRLSSHLYLSPRGVGIRGGLLEFLLQRPLEYLRSNKSDVLTTLQSLLDPFDRLELPVTVYVFSGARGFLCGQQVLLHFADSYRFHLYGASFAQAVRDVRHRCPASNITMVHSGDVFFSCRLCDQAQGHHVPPLFKLLDVRVMVPGNHDFDRGVDVFHALAAKMDGIGMILSNVLLDHNSQSVSVIAEMGYRYRLRWTSAISLDSNTRTAYIGLWDNSTLHSCDGSVRTRLKLISPIEAATKWCGFARRFTSGFACVCLTHMSDASDLALAAARVCDVVLGGHEHHYLLRPDISLAKTGTDFRDLTVVHLRDKHGSSWFEHFDVTPSFRRRSQDFEESVRHFMGAANSTVLCRLRSGDPSNMLYSRNGPTTIGTHVARLLMDHFQADIGIICSGYFRWDMPISDGLMTQGIFDDMMPFSSTPLCVRCSHAQLCRDLLHMTVSYPADDGRYPQLAGIKLSINTSAIGLRRIHAMFATGHTLNCSDEDTITRIGSRTFDAGSNGYLLPNCGPCDDDDQLISIETTDADVREMTLHSFKTRAVGQFTEGSPYLCF